MAVLRLEPIAPARVDRAIAALGPVRLSRAQSGLFLAIEDAVVPAALRQLALAGTRAAVAQRMPEPAAGLAPAVGRDLTPFAATFPGVDTLELRPISLGVASARLLRRPRWRSVARAARQRCVRLLRAEDAVLAWRRIAWCPVATLRTREVRRVLRPVVFDRGALERGPARWAFVGDGEIARWAFG